MEITGKKIGFAMTGSFCTFKRVLTEVENLAKLNADIIPIMSTTAYSTDTRFGSSEYFKNQLYLLTGNKIISTIAEAEPIGPKGYLDLLIIAPCTGNTLAKLASGVTDTSVTMAAKAHLRNQKPVLIAVSTNDGLGNAAKNIGMLLNYKNLFFVPFGQDDFIKKPNSLVADMSLICNAAEAALSHKQLQPILN